jgi:hypothetical protein
MRWKGEGHGISSTLISMLDLHIVLKKWLGMREGQGRVRLMRYWVCILLSSVGMAAFTIYPRIGKNELL